MRRLFLFEKPIVAASAGHAIAGGMMLLLCADVRLASDESVSRFFDKHAAHKLGDAVSSNALRLMEIQRQSMLMYTSCGWFFDELSGIETVQVLHYAGRAIQLAETIGLQRLGILPNDIRIEL